MDRERFDELARLLATKGSRRSALGTLISVAILGHDPDDAGAKPGKSKGKAKAKRKGHDKGRGKGHDKGKGQGHTETEEPGEVQPEEVRAAPESDDVPDVQAETQGGGGRGKKKAKGSGKGKGKGRNKNKKQSGRTANQIQGEAVRCCGTKSCVKPTQGSYRAECNFAGQNLSGGNYKGSNFEKIDGRGTNFDNTNLRGSNFHAACLQGAMFRGADVYGTNFDEACLFGADLTGAKNLNASVNFDKALLCDTTLPDGTVSDSDCAKATTCCAACDAQRPCDGGQICCNGRCVDGECCATGDCDDQQCQTKSCVGNECDYTPVTNGPGPLCNTTCCNGVCCTAGQVCNTAANPDVCCTPETTDQTCGVGTQNPKCGTVNNNCGKPVNCGACAERLCQNGSCNDDTDLCSYSPVTNGQQGPLCNDSGEFCCGGDECCIGGQVCFSNNCCTPRTCPANACGTISNGCGGTIDCPDCPGGQVCVENTCQACTTTDQCNENEICCDGTCQVGNCCPTAGASEGVAVTCNFTNQNCCATGCIGNNNINNCGECGNRCPNDICRVRTCVGGECGFTLVPNGDQGFDCDAESEFCCQGSCCTSGQVCNTGPDPDVCCTPDTQEETCRPFEGPQRCGISVVNNCGQLIDCGDCDVLTCQTANCNGAPDGTCQYTDVFGTTGPNCTTTVCCRNTEGDPVCCPEGITICSTPGGLCGCGGDNDCGENEICCDGQCIANTLCCNNNPSTCPDPGTCKVRACNGAGECEPANAAPSTQCTVGQDLGICCSGECLVDDPDNCTACGTACPADVCEIATCDNRVCGVTLVNDAQAEGCNGEGFLCCEGSCKDTDTDEDNCGGCAPPNGDGDICVEPGELCVEGVCVCNAESCPTGCCSNGPGNPGVCQTSSDTTCGTQGEICVDCPDGNVCVNGNCVCTAASCPDGCCSNGPGNAGTCQTSGNDTCGINGVQCVDCPIGTPFCNASGVCVACLTPANCPTPPTCSVATCTAGVCGTAPLQDVQGPGCTAAGKICCNGFCVDDQAGQCPICCQSPEICREAFGPNAQCVGSGACQVGGIDTCISTGKCCRP